MVSLRWFLLIPVVAAVVALQCRSVPREGVHPQEDEIDEEQAVSARAEGERLWEVSPRTLITVEQSLEWFQRVARSLPEDYEACWKGARAAEWLAGRAPTDEERKRFALDAIALGNSAVAASPAGPEGHYYLANAMGQLADVDHAYGLDAVRRMEQDCLAVIAADERFAHAGAQRLVGILYFQCPGPPTSIGSPRKARKHLDRALELAPDWPLNHLWRGSLAAEEGDLERARKEFEAVLASRIPPGYETESEEWKRDARKNMEGLKR